jgi:ABC-2 type transport system permease protein
MTRWWRIYLVLLRVSWLNAVEYRAQVVLWFMAMIFPLVMMAVWLALVREAGSINGWDQADFASYYVAAALIQIITIVYIVWDWDDHIRLGKLSPKLLKPIDPIHEMIMMEAIGWKLVMTAFASPFFLAAVVLSPQLRYPMSPPEFLALIVSCLLANVMTTFIGSAFGMLAFWTTQSMNLFMLFFGVGQFLSGFIAPLAMFPESFQDLAHWLPFRSYVGFPVEIMLGRLNSGEILQGLGVTLVWTVIFFFIYRLLWRYGLKRYEAVGA